MGDYTIPTEGFRWFWAPDLEDATPHVKRRYGSGFYLKVADDRGTVDLHNSWPVDTTTDPDEPELTFESVSLYTAPVYSGNGYEVTRLPTRPLIAQLFREATHTSDEVPAMSPNGPRSEEH